MKNNDLPITMPQQKRLRESPLNASALFIGQAPGATKIGNRGVRFDPLSPLKFETNWHQPGAEISSQNSLADPVPLLLVALASASTLGKL